MQGRKTNRSMVINFAVPEFVADGDLAAFIVDALESWGGQYRPDDPLFQSLSINHIKLNGTQWNNPEPKQFRNKVRT